MTKQQFLQRVMERAGLNDAAQAEQVTEAVFSTLHQRITPEEASHVKAQLPPAVKEMWEGNLLDKMVGLVKRAERLNRQEFLQRVADKSGLDVAKAELATRVVFGLLQEQIDQGEAHDVAAQLPPDLRAVWEGSASLESRCCDVMQKDWVPFLIGFTNAHQGEKVQLQVGSQSRGMRVVADNQPLLNIEPECKQDRVLRMDVALGGMHGAHPEHLVHYVEEPERLVLETTPDGSVRSLIFEAQNGDITWVRLAA